MSRLFPSSHGIVRRAGPIALRALLNALPTIALLILLVFILLKSAPGDTADILISQAGVADAETMARLKDHYASNEPAWRQLLTYVGNILHFNLGTSAQLNEPVLDLILSRLPYSLMLLAGWLFTSVTLGLLLGIFLYRFADRAAGHVARGISLIVYSLPNFWVALLLIILFSVRLGWLDSSGFETIGAGFTGLDHAVDLIRHALMPVLALSLFSAALYGRLVRTSMIDVSYMDYIKTARAKGLPERTVMLRHILPNALGPLVTMVSFDAGALIGGAAVVEAIFGWPGLGSLALDAFNSRDFAVLMGVLLVASLFVILTNLVADIIHALLEPQTDGH